MPDDALEREKLTFEREKWKDTLALEAEKLTSEERGRRISTAGVVVPLLIVAATIFENTCQQAVQSRADFELKAAEVVLSPRTVTESQNRADGLVELLPDRFPRDFARRLDPVHARLRQPAEPDKGALMSLLAAAPTTQRKDILELWLAFHPQDRGAIPDTVFKLVEIWSRETAK